MEHTVAIQGIQGSFHHQVALTYFNTNVETLHCLSFPKLVGALVNESCKHAVMAIENSIAGSILPNYALIDQNNLQIVGEYYMDIQQHLMVLPGQLISDIKEVHSHPMALLQCQSFFAQYPSIKLVEDVDTAATAARIREHNLKGIGAIGSVLAAALFELEVLASHIQTVKNNSTRFLILEKKSFEDQYNATNKVTLKFVLADEMGSLASVLAVLHSCQLNMTKIQSLPVVENPWHYSFFVDLTYKHIKDLKNGLQLLTGLTTELKILGAYNDARL